MTDVVISLPILGGGEVFLGIIAALAIVMIIARGIGIFL